MFDIFLKLAPIFVIFTIGYLLKVTKHLKEEDADLFLKLNFLVATPALVLLSISKITLNLQLIYIPIIASLIVMATYFISYFLGHQLKLNRKMLGVLFVGTMIVNTGFTIPFITAAYGQEGLARIILFDFGSELIGLTIAYYLACRYGNSSKSNRESIIKVFTSPLFIALILGGIINITSFQIPKVGESILALLGNLLVPLVMLSLGLRFNLKIKKFAPVMVGIFIRTVCGFILGCFFVYLFKLQGLSKVITLITSASPIGYMTLTFAAMEDLDKEYAASLVSFSILTGLIIIPLLILFIR